MLKSLLLPWLALGICAQAAPPAAPPPGSLLKPGEVITFVGGEDLVSAAEDGFLEFLLVRARPRDHLRFRSLAWEGDTVFEQRRDLNYPPLEEQLDKIGATLVLAQFGQMEALEAARSNAGGTAADATYFNQSYARLLARLGFAPAGAKRKFVLIEPTPLEETAAARLTSNAPAPTSAPTSAAALAALAGSLPCPALLLGAEFHNLQFHGFTREGVHLNERGQVVAARLLAAQLLNPSGDESASLPPVEATRFPLAQTDGEKRLLQLIVEKNRLWFHSYRPQNWAFLAGDRTTQPSSRDYKDPSIRWFPAEMEQWLPLIEKKEAAIDTLAEQLQTEAKP